MPVVNLDKVMHTASRMHLQLHHFARGTYPEAIGEPSALPLNRFFLPVSNPDGDACYIRDRNLCFPLRPGCAYFIPVYHMAEVNLSSRLFFLSIQFTLECYDGVDLFSRCRSIREVEDPLWLERAEEAFRTRETFAAASRLRGITQDFVSFLLESVDGETLESVTRLAEFLPELDYIRSHCSAKTGIEELAAVRGVRREVFSRAFSHASGIPPKQFLTRALLNRACGLLLRGNRQVREVAFELGFANEFYFSRFFRKHTGIPPSRFAKRYTEE